ncbi:conserved hypothetical protein [delta proteobacterium NaphS2]|nr:conserved hypothetical protein [delta proteobacterium NaphS2]
MILKRIKSIPIIGLLLILFKIKGVMPLRLLKKNPV